MGRKDKDIPLENGEPTSLGSRLRYARQREGISLTQMAQELRYTKSHLSAVETGSGHASPHLIEDYERRLGLGLGELARGNGKRSAPGREQSILNEDVREKVQEKDSGDGERKGRREARLLRQSAHMRAGHGHNEDWGDAPTVKNFYGREEELADLRRWIVDERSPVVALSGFGGVGKTALAIMLGKQLMQIEGEFTFLIWHSLRDAPSVEDMLRECIRSFSSQRHVEFPASIDEQITLFIEHLQRFRCLVIFDNFESVLRPGSLSGEYQQGYEAYGRLLERVGKVKHQSCFLLTSREEPREIARLEVEEPGVRSLLLPGMREKEAESILRENALAGSDSAFSELIGLYSGNPLALRLIAASIRDLFGNNIDAFLEASRSGSERGEEAIMVGDVADLLGQQFERLSNQERSVMYWLTIEREGISPGDLLEDNVQPISKGRLFQILETLRHRSMIEPTGNGRFTLQPAIMEYVTDNFISKVYKEIIDGKIEALADFWLVKAQAKDYVRSIQTRVILAPVAYRLLTAFGKEESEKKLKGILAQLHETHEHTPGYAAGNILNLLVQLECDLRGYDFSHLYVWQANLQKARLPGVNFAHAELGKSIFTDTFERVLTAKLSPDGIHLAAGTGSGDVYIWDASGDTPMPLYICRGHTDWVRSITFSQDGKMLVSGSDDQTIRLWDVETGTCLSVLQGPSRVFSVALHPDGNTLASGHQDEIVRVWDWRTEECLHKLTGHMNRIWSVAFSPEGDMLASGSNDHTVRLWDVNRGECLRELKGHSHRVRSVAFSPDGVLLASGSKDSTIGIWEVKTGQLLRRIEGSLRGVKSVAFSPTGKILACGTDDRTIQLLDVDTGHPIKTIEGHTSWIRSVAFSSDGKTIVTSSEDQTVRLWEASTGQCLKTLQGYTEWVYAVAFSPDGKVVATGGGDLVVRLWKWEQSTERPIRALEGQTDWVRSIAFSPNGELLAAGGEDNMVRLWRVSTGERLRKLEKHSGWVYAVAFSPDGELLASGSEDHTICLWRVSTGQPIKTLLGHPNWVRSVAFSPDGELLASGGEDKTVRLWRVSTGQLIETLEGHSGRIYAVAFSPDGKMFASGSEDGVIKLWDTDTRQPLLELQSHAGRIWSIAFSPDGELLASGSEDCTVRLWTVSTGQPFKTFSRFTNRVYSVAFSPDGKTIAGGSPDGTVKLWSVNAEGVQTLKSERPYEDMNISGLEGLLTVQKDMLKALGAVEQE